MIKKDFEKSDGSSVGSNHWAVIEAILNSANHMLIGITTFYLTWYCFHYGFSDKTTWHVYLTTIGYQLLMAEGIMAFYSKNSFTLLNTQKTKKNIHWILQAIGIVLVLAGTIIEIIYKSERNLSHFESIHAILGLVSVILLLFTFFNGIAAIYSVELKKIIKPLYSKISHSILAILTFVIGMASIIDGYQKHRYMKRNDPGGVNEWMVVFYIVIIFLTVIGPLKNLYSQIKTVFNK